MEDARLIRSILEDIATLNGMTPSDKLSCLPPVKTAYKNHYSITLHCGTSILDTCRYFMPAFNSSYQSLLFFSWSTVQNSRAYINSMLNSLFFAGLGVKLVLAVGTQHQVDTELKEAGMDPRYVGGYRVSFPNCLEPITRY